MQEIQITPKSEMLHLTLINLTDREFRALREACICKWGDREGKEKFGKWNKGKLLNLTHIRSLI